MVGGVLQKDYCRGEERRVVLPVDGGFQKDYCRDEGRGVVEWIQRAMSESLDWVAPTLYTNLAQVSRDVHPRRRRVRVLQWSVRQDRAQVRPEVLLLPLEISPLVQTLQRPSS